jgi:hypothetical protein
MKESKKKNNNIIIYLLPIFLLFLVLMFVHYSLKILERPTKEEKAYMRAKHYRTQAKRHLEEKYGEEFFVGDYASWTGSNGPLPFSYVKGETYYRAYALSDEDFVFRVYITEEDDSDEIELIEDNYCWKFIRDDLRELITPYLDELFGDDYKLFVYGLSSYETYPNSVLPSSTLEEFFENNNYFKARYSVYIQDDQSLDNDIISEGCREIIKNIAESSNGSIPLELIVFSINDKEQYELIDETRHNFEVENRYYLMKHEGKEEKLIWNNWKWQEQYRQVIFDSSD